MFSGLEILEIARKKRKKGVLKLPRLTTTGADLLAVVSAPLGEPHALILGSGLRQGPFDVLWRPATGCDKKARGPIASEDLQFGDC